MDETHGLYPAKAFADLDRALFTDAVGLEVEQAGHDLKVVARLVMDFLDQGIPVRKRRLEVGRALVDLTLERPGQVVELKVAFRQTAGRDLQFLQGDAELLLGVGRFRLAGGQAAFQQQDGFLIARPLAAQRFHGPFRPGKLIGGGRQLAVKTVAFGGGELQLIAKILAFQKRLFLAGFGSFKPFDKFVGAGHGLDGVFGRTDPMVPACHDLAPSVGRPGTGA